MNINLIHNFQALTVAIGPRAGVRGAGCNDLSSLKWLNGIKVRGATALQISEAEAKEKPLLLKECFKHSVNRQFFAASLRERIVSQISEICPAKCQKDRLCSTCFTAVNRKFEQEASRASAWCDQSEGINWDNVRFPAGLEDIEVFSQNNPQICISLYRAAEDKGDVYLFYRSKLGELPRSSQKMIHIVSVTRLDTLVMELETHFLPVTNLDAFCSLIYEYDNKDGNISTKYQQGNNIFLSTRPLYLLLILMMTLSFVTIQDLRRISCQLIRFLVATKNLEKLSPVQFPWKVDQLTTDPPQILVGDKGQSHRLGPVGRKTGQKQTILIHF